MTDIIHSHPGNYTISCKISKYTKKLKEQVQQSCCGNYTGNKCDFIEATHRYNNRAQTQHGMKVAPTAQHIEVLEENLQGQHQPNVLIDPTTAESMYCRNLVIEPTKYIW